MSADAPLEDILRALDDVGVVVLRGAAPTLLVARLHAEHARLLRTIEPDIESLQAEMRCASGARHPCAALRMRSISVCGFACLRADRRALHVACWLQGRAQSG